MHSVKDGKGKTHVNNDSPHAELIELRFGIVVKLRTSSKCRHDPQLWETQTKGLVFSRAQTVNLREQSTHNGVAQQQKHTDLPQHPPLPLQFVMMFHGTVVVLRLCVGVGFFLRINFFKVALVFA